MTVIMTTTTIKRNSSIISKIWLSIMFSKADAVRVEKFLCLFHRIKQNPVPFNGPAECFPYSFDHRAAMVLVAVLILRIRYPSGHFLFPPNGLPINSRAIFVAMFNLLCLLNCS